MQKHFSVLIILLIMSTLAFSATTGKIAGTITDANTGEPLPGANVVINGTRMGGSTDLEGNYFIINVPPGTYELTATMMGYQQITKTNVAVNIDKTTQIDFELSQEVIEGKEVTIVAEKPIIELDLTASKQRMTGDELDQSWVNTAEEAISVQSGTNVRGGIRGGFGHDVVYYLDGMMIKNPQSNSNFSGAINTSAVEEMEVLTGGWNAEYGHANSAIVNVVSKSARDRFHGSIQYRYRPAGLYHWGRNIYSKDNYEWQIMATRDYWDPNATFIDYDGIEKSGNDGGSNWKDQTPEERLAAWQRYISHELFGAQDLLMDYDKRAQHEIEGSVYGPITSKLDFLVTARYVRGAPKFPSSLEYNPNYNYQGKLSYQLTNATKLSVMGVYHGYTNTGTRQSGYWTTEDSQAGGGQASPRFISGYDSQKYWPYGGGHPGGMNTAPPEHSRMYSGQFKLTHVFNASTYLDVLVSHMRTNTDTDFDQVIEGTWYMDNDYITNAFGDQDLHVPDNRLFRIPRAVVRHPEYVRHSWWARNTKLKADFTSQLNTVHQVKAGLEFSTQYYDEEGSWGHEKNINFTDLTDNVVNPYEAAAYLQDKMEFKGMIVNAGIRLDMFNANKKISDTIWDPQQIWDQHPANPGETGLRSFDPDGQYAENSTTQIAISPRIGISHPITESTVMHFMYGHFNMRPAWYKIVSNGGYGFKPWPGSMDVTEGVKDPTEYPDYQDWLVYYWHFYRFGNPALEYEKVIQYEVGFDQDIAGVLGLDVTLYYKDGKNLSTLGIQADQGTVDYYGTSNSVTTWMMADPNNPNKRKVGNLGRFIIPLNGGYLDTRGLEATLETKFSRWINLRLIYNMSFALTGRYGLQRVYREWDGQKFSRDNLWDVGNRDGGTAGNTNENWNPHNTLKVHANFSTPSEFGPNMGQFHPLGSWHLNVYTLWAGGQQFTYHSPGDLSSEPLNQTWKPFNRTNIRLSKRIPMTSGLNAELTMDVINLFNNKRLRRPGGDDLERYMENGELPIHPQTKETLEWTIYDFSTLPREIFFGVRFLF